MSKLKVLTYNIHQWEGQDGRMDVERLATIIAASGAQIVSLNEVLHPFFTPLGQSEPLAELARLLGMDWAFGESYRICQRLHGWGPIGNAVLSRFPIVDAVNHSLPRLPMTQGRNLLKARLRLGLDKHFTIYSTHLDHAFEGTRLWQLRGIVGNLRGNGHDPHLLMGDFNTHTPAGANGQRFAPPVVRRLRNEGYIDAFSIAGAGQPHTFRYFLPALRLDYIFVPEQMTDRLTMCRTLRGGPIEMASDHLPVLAEFDWR